MGSRLGGYCQGIASYLLPVFLHGQLWISLALWSTPPAWAGGFTQPEGRIFTDVTLRTLEAGSFEKVELQLFIEYGLQDDLTLIWKSPYNWIENDVGEETLRNQGFIDQEIGVRWRFNNDPNLATAIQGILILPPGYDPDQNLALGTDNVGIEIRFPVSWIYSLGQRQGILTAEIAYRDFLGTQGSEIRWFAEVSQNVLDRITLVAQLENTNGLAELQTDLTKLTGNVQVKVNPNLTLVVGGFRHIQGPSGQGLEFKVFFSSN